MQYWCRRISWTHFPSRSLPKQSQDLLVRQMGPSIGRDSCWRNGILIRRARIGFQIMKNWSIVLYLLGLWYLPKWWYNTVVKCTHIDPSSFKVGKEFFSQAHTDYESLLSWCRAMALRVKIPIRKSQEELHWSLLTESSIHLLWAFHEAVQIVGTVAISITTDSIEHLLIIVVVSPDTLHGATALTIGLGTWCKWGEADLFQTRVWFA